MTIELNKRLSPDSLANEHDVREIKRALNHLGYYIPLSQTGITGISDLKLFSALKAFQKDHELIPTGTLKPEDKTIDALNKATQNKDGEYIWRTWRNFTGTFWQFSKQSNNGESRQNRKNLRNHQTENKKQGRSTKNNRSLIAKSQN